VSKSQTSTTAVDPAQRQIAETVWAKAQEIGNKPYQAYNGQLVQGFAPDQLAAYDLVRQGVQGNVGAGYLGQAGQSAQTAAAYQPQFVQAPNLGFASQAHQYMDPYENRWANDVVNTTLSDLDRSRQMAIGQGEDSALRAGAYGGSRHGVADSLTNEAALRQAATTAAQLRSQGFNTAAQYGAGDAGAANQYGLTQGQLTQQAGLANQQAGLAGANLGLAAGQQLSALSDQERAQYFQNSAALETVGAAEQTQGQRELDSAYQQWLREQNYANTQLQALTAGAPSNLGMSVTQNPSQAATWGQGLNTLGGLLSFFNQKPGG
jgi:hypothetical protein